MIYELSMMLDTLKGVRTGTSSKSNNKLVMDFNNKRYIVHLKEIENPNEDVFEDIEEYLG